MRYVLIGALLAAVVLGAGCGHTVAPPATGSPPQALSRGAAGGPGIAWQTQREQAFAAAQQAKKPLMVKFFTTWCGYCKLMDKTTLREPQVVAAAKGFVALRVDAEKDAAFAQRYGVTGYPTVVFLAPDGRELGRVRGAVPASPLLAEMSRAQGRFGSGGASG